MSLWNGQAYDSYDWALWDVVEEVERDTTNASKIYRFLKKSLHSVKETVRSENLTFGSARIEQLMVLWIEDGVWRLLQSYADTDWFPSDKCQQIFHRFAVRSEILEFALSKTEADMGVYAPPLSAIDEAIRRTYALWNPKDAVADLVSPASPGRPASSGDQFGGIEPRGAQRQSASPERTRTTQRSEVFASCSPGQIHTRRSERSELAAADPSPPTNWDPAPPRKGSISDLKGGCGPPAVLSAGKGGKPMAARPPAPGTAPPYPAMSGHQEPPPQQMGKGSFNGPQAPQGSPWQKGPPRQMGSPRMGKGFPGMLPQKGGKQGPMPDAYSDGGKPASHDGFAGGKPGFSVMSNSKGKPGVLQDGKGKPGGLHDSAAPEGKGKPGGLQDVGVFESKGKPGGLQDVGVFEGKGKPGGLQDGGGPPHWQGPGPSPGKGQLPPSAQKGGPPGKGGPPLMGCVGPGKGSMPDGGKRSMSPAPVKMPPGISDGKPSSCQLSGKPCGGNPLGKGDGKKGLPDAPCGGNPLGKGDGKKGLPDAPCGGNPLGKGDGKKGLPDAPCGENPLGKGGSKKGPPPGFFGPPSGSSEGPQGTSALNPQISKGGKGSTESAPLQPNFQKGGKGLLDAPLPAGHSQEETPTVLHSPERPSGATQPPKKTKNKISLPQSRGNAAVSSVQDVDPWAAMTAATRPPNSPVVRPTSSGDKPEESVFEC